MSDTPIEIIWMIIMLSIAFPMLMFIFDRSRDTIFLSMSLFLMGSIWIVFFAFLADGITLSDGSSFALTEEDGSWNSYKMFLTLLGVLFIAMGMVTEPRLVRRYA